MRCFIISQQLYDRISAIISDSQRECFIPISLYNTILNLLAKIRLNRDGECLKIRIMYLFLDFGLKCILFFSEFTIFIFINIGIIKFLLKWFLKIVVLVCMAFNLLNLLLQRWQAYLINWFIFHFLLL